MNSDKNSIASIFSFFSGAGFLDLGFEDEGFDIAYVNEFHQPFLEAYKHSRCVLARSQPLFGYDPASIEDVDLHRLKGNVEQSKLAGNLVGFLGGPPCPDFSVAGKNHGRNGENGKLSKVYADLICEILPDFFLFENVKGLYRTKIHRQFFDELKSKFEASGYHLHEKLINSLEYGVPQDRERIILVGFLDASKNTNFDWLGAAYDKSDISNVIWPITNEFVEDGYLSMPGSVPKELTVEYWFKKNNVTTHPNSKHCFVPRAGKVKFEIIPEGDDKKKSYKRLHRWRYSPTAAYGNNEVHLHPYKVRRLSAAEALAVQSLPASFELPCDMTLSNMFKTIGNGVPYLAAKGLAKSISNHLGVENAYNSSKYSKSHQSTAA